MNMGIKKIKEPENLYDISPVYYDALKKRFLVKAYNGWYELDTTQDIFTKERKDNGSSKNKS
jgi:hypothetical protein